jgi:GTP pyrophosphokinase
MWSPTLTQAFDFAARLHRSQTRKGSSVPYLSHLLAVAAQVMDWGGDESAVITALLHDAVEDQGGLETLEEIRRRFGSRVAEMVRGCSDAFTTPKPPWRERKERFLAELPGADPQVRLVVAADKLHNLQCILRDHRLMGEPVWDRFRGGREGTLWYYRELIAIFRSAGPAAASRELEEQYSLLLAGLPEASVRGPAPPATSRK